MSWGQSFRGGVQLGGSLSFWGINPNPLPQPGIGAFALFLAEGLRPRLLPGSGMCPS